MGVWMLVMSEHLYMKLLCKGPIPMWHVDTVGHLGLYPTKN